MWEVSILLEILHRIHEEEVLGEEGGVSILLEILHWPYSGLTGPRTKCFNPSWDSTSDDGQLFFGSMYRCFNPSWDSTSPHDPKQNQKSPDCFNPSWDSTTAAMRRWITSCLNGFNPSWDSTHGNNEDCHPGWSLKFQPFLRFYKHMHGAWMRGILWKRVSTLLEILHIGRGWWMGHIPTTSSFNPSWDSTAQTQNQTSTENQEGFNPSWDSTFFFGMPNRFYDN